MNTSAANMMTIRPQADPIPQANTSAMILAQSAGTPQPVSRRMNHSLSTAPVV